MAFLTTVPASLVGKGILPHVTHHFSGDDAGGYGEDSITQDHDEGGKELPEFRYRRDVAIAYGSEGDDGPVDAAGDTGKAFVLAAFHKVHNGTDDDDEQQDEGQEYCDFGPAGLQGADDDLAFRKEMAKLENPEYPEQPEGADNQQILGAINDQADVSWQDGQQVYNAEKGGSVFGRPIDAIEPQDIFDRKDDGKEPLQGVEKVIVMRLEAPDAFQRDDQYAGHDEYKQDYIKCFSRRRIGLENYLVDFFLQFISPDGWHELSFTGRKYEALRASPYFQPFLLFGLSLI